MGQELLIELISDCNLKCKMCAFKQGFSHESMSEEMICDLFHQINIINQKSKLYNFTDLRMDGNSEPLLYKDPGFVMNLAMQAGIQYINITTNGVLLNYEMTDRLMDTSLTTLDISMTGIIPEIYSEFQGYGLKADKCKEQITRIKENVQYFIKQKIRWKKNITLTMRYIITPMTKPHFGEYIDYFRSIRADAVMGMTLTNTGLRGKCHPYEEIVGRKRCESPEHPVICANGDVLMAFCPYDIPILGNMIERPLSDILMAPQTEKWLTSIRKIIVEDMPINCKSCHNTHIYKGGKW